jgi:nucleotide-binding universal stress UspA family protein
MKRILLAVDDSPAALAAATVAVDIASLAGSALRIVHVVPDGAVTTVLSTRGVEDIADWQRRTGGGLLDHIAAQAERAGIHPETAQVLGEPADCVLTQARSWRFVTARVETSGPAVDSPAMQPSSYGTKRRLTARPNLSPTVGAERSESCG